MKEESRSTQGKRSVLVVKDLKRKSWGEGKKRKWQKKESERLIVFRLKIPSPIQCILQVTLHGSNCCLRVKWGVISINNQGKGLDFL